MILTSFAAFCMCIKLIMIYLLNCLFKVFMLFKFTTFIDTSLSGDAYLLLKMAQVYYTLSWILSCNFAYELNSWFFSHWVKVKLRLSLTPHFCINFVDSEPWGYLMCWFQKWCPFVAATNMPVKVKIKSDAHFCINFVDSKVIWCADYKNDAHLWRQQPNLA